MRRTPKLGQHFLTGLWAAKALAEAVNVRPDETILEIGPGKGALTQELLATGAHVIAIEKDGALVRGLNDGFRKSIIGGQLTLVEMDIRDFDPARFNLASRSYVLAANIPYYITGEIIRQFLETSTQPRALALLVQKEVTQRILAGNGKESILSISVKVYGTPKIIAKVSKGNFSPPPSVDSAILLIDNVSKEFFSGIDEHHFFKVVKTGFSSKRKFLANNLSNVFDKENVRTAFLQCNLDEKIRAEDVQLEQWKSLATLLQ